MIITELKRPIGVFNEKDKKEEEAIDFVKSKTEKLLTAKLLSTKLDVSAAKKEEEAKFTVLVVVRVIDIAFVVAAIEGITFDVIPAGEVIAFTIVASADNTFEVMVFTPVVIGLVTVLTLIKEMMFFTN